METEEDNKIVFLDQETQQETGSTADRRGNNLGSDLVVIIIFTVTVLQKRISISKLIHFKVKYRLF